MIVADRRVRERVALLQNEGWRDAKATQRKLNAIAAALAELMDRSEESSTAR